MTLRAQASKIYYGFKKEAAKITYNKKIDGPDYLSSDMLKRLDSKYTYDNKVFYDFDSNMARAKERYFFMRDKLEGFGKSLKGADVLELGCGDGLICALMNENGSKSAAIDVDNSLFDQYATDRDVKYYTMDAEKLTFPDSSFDFIFSHNGFEHFGDPAAVLNECKRVLRPGGIMYFQFNPMYYSPFGYHAYKSIAIPYMHILFSQKDFTKYASENGRPAIVTDPSFLNRKTASYFRNLFRDSKDKRFRELYYLEETNYYFVDFIRKYPSCFKKENVSFEDFITSGIRLWMQRVS